MSISRTADTITVTADGRASLILTGLSDGRISDGVNTFTREQAIESALALVTLATGTLVRRNPGEKNYRVINGESLMFIEPASFGLNDEESAAWAVHDLTLLAGVEAARALAGEPQESLARQFPFLTDEQAKAISNHFASL